MIYSLIEIAAAGGSMTAIFFGSVTLGTGEIDIPMVLKAAKKSKVKYYYIEDESPIATQQVPESIKYVKKLGL